jgi:hypothetical protein
MEEVIENLRIIRSSCHEIHTELRGKIENIFNRLERIENTLQDLLTRQQILVDMLGPTFNPPTFDSSNQAFTHSWSEHAGSSHPISNADAVSLQHALANDSLNPDEPF